MGVCEHAPRLDMCCRYLKYKCESGPLINILHLVRASLGTYRARRELVPFRAAALFSVTKSRPQSSSIKSSPPSTLSSSLGIMPITLITSPSRGGSAGGVFCCFSPWPLWPPRPPRPPPRGI